MIREKGITLIALVVTIILLIILSGVVINMSFKEGGIFKTAKESKKIYEIEAIKEKINLEIASLEMEKIRKNEGSPSLQEILERLLQKGIIVSYGDIDEQTQSVEVVTENGYVIKITKNPLGGYILEQIEIDEREKYKSQIKINVTPEGLAEQKTVTITWPQELEGKEGVEKRISIDGGKTYTPYTGEVIITENTTIYAELEYDEGKTVTVTKEVTQIYKSSIYAKLYNDGTLVLNTTGKLAEGRTEGDILLETGDIEEKSLGIVPWCEAQYANKVKVVVFEEKIYPKNTPIKFNGCKELTTINNIENLNTSFTTDMSAMFWMCSKLTNLDVSGFDTSNVTTMASMFYNCTSLTSLDVSNFDTNNVTGMSGMFANCSNIDYIDVSNFKTSKVTNMAQMFQGCSKLTSLDISNFDTGNVTNVWQMFVGMTKITNLDLSNFDTTKMTSMSNLFMGCNALTNLNIGSFDTSNVTEMQNMFKHCKSLTQLDLSNFDTHNVTNMSEMFYSCSELTTIYVSDKWNVNNVVNSNSMFAQCTNLRGAISYNVSKLDKNYANYKNGYLTKK